MPAYRNLRAIMKRSGALLALLVLLGANYLFCIRPAQLHWGATQAEVASILPEDDVVTQPDFDATRAITIRARPEEIWPWLVQMGYGRAGFYGYDLIENPGGGAGIRSATRILPAYQHPGTGDPLPLSVVAKLAFSTIEPNRCLVWRAIDAPPTGVFIWELVPVDSSRTRLISRIRWRYLKTWQGRALGIFTEFTDHVAVRAILMGIRDRVEHRPTRTLLSQASEIGAWIAACSAFTGAAAFTLISKEWVITWLVALGAGLLVQFELYVASPTPASALLSLTYLALTVWHVRKMRLRCDRIK